MLVLSPEPVLVLSPEPVLVISPEPVLVISPFRTPADCTPFAPDNSKEEDFSSGAWPIGASANSVGELAELAPQPMDFATVRCRVRSAHKISSDKYAHLFETVEKQKGNSQRGAEPLWLLRIDMCPSLPLPCSSSPCSFCLAPARSARAARMPSVNPGLVAVLRRWTSAAEDANHSS